MRPSIVAGLWAVSASAFDLDVPKTKDPVRGMITSQGCFTNEADMTLMADVSASLVSTGTCSQRCRKDKDEEYSVMAVSGQKCWCGSKMPQKQFKTSDDACNYPCPGYPMEPCGGIGDGEESKFSVYNLGVEINPPVYKIAPEDSKADDGSGDDDNDDDNGKADDGSADNDNGDDNGEASSTVTNSATGSSVPSPTGDESSAATTTSTPANSSVDEPTQTSADTESQTSDSDSEEDSTDEPGMGSSMGSSFAAVVAVAGASGLWFLM